MFADRRERIGRVVRQHSPAARRSDRGGVGSRQRRGFVLHAPVVPPLMENPAITQKDLAGRRHPLRRRQDRPGRSHPARSPLAPVEGRSVDEPGVGHPSSKDLAQDDPSHQKAPITRRRVGPLQAITPWCQESAKFPTP